METASETTKVIIEVQKEGELSDYVNTAWIVSVLRGLVISLILFFSAPIVSSFFHSLNSFHLIRLIALAAFLRGFINPAIVKFQKNLEFKKEFYLRISCVFVDVLVSIIVALITKSAVALVWGMIASVIVELFVSHVLIKPRPTFSFEKLKFRHVVNRGKWVTLAGIFQYLFANGDNIVVGRIMDTIALGYYQMAYRISAIPITEISDVFGKVAFPTYSKIIKDKIKLRDIFLRLFLITFIIIFPIGVILFLFTDSVVNIFLGSNWLVIVPTLKVLSLFGVLRALEGTTPSLFLAVKKQEYVTVLTFISVAGMAVPIIPLVMKFGMIGAAYSALFGSLLSLPIIIYYLQKVLKT